MRPSSPRHLCPTRLAAHAEWTIAGRYLQRNSAFSVAIATIVVSCAPLDYRPADPVRPDGPLSIEAAIQLALQNNPDVLVAEERVNEARAAIDEASSYYWPVLQLLERFTQTDTPSQAFSHILDQRRFDSTLDFNDPGVTSNVRTGVGGSITLYDGGRRRARVMGAEARATSEAARAEMVKRDLALEIARAFYLIHKAAELASTQEKSLETLATHLRITEARLVEGAARRSEVLAVRVRQAETREAVIIARNSSARARAGLHVMLGLSITDAVELEEPRDEEIAASRALDDLLETALRNRFELAESENRVRVAQARLKEVWAGYFPDITVFGSFGFDDRDPALSHANWTWGVSVVEDLFDALRTPYRVRQAFANLKSAHATFRKAFLAVELDVKNAVLDAAEADARFEVSEQAVQLAEESLRLVEVEYNEGAADVTRLLDAETALTRARTRLNAAKYDRALSRVAIAHAIGEFPAPPEATASEETRPETGSEEQK